MTAPTKRAKRQDLYLWHQQDGGRLYETEGLYFSCASCEADVLVRETVPSWENRSPGPMTDGEATIHRAFFE